MGTLQTRQQRRRPVVRPDASPKIDHRDCQADSLPRIYRLVRPAGIGWAVREFSRDDLARLIDSPELPFQCGTRETIKLGATAQLVRVELPVGGRLTPVAYKRVRRKTWIKVLTALFRRNRILRSWEMSHCFLEHRVPTARPLAVVFGRRFNVTRDSYVVIEWLEEGRNLDDYRRWLETVDSEQQHRYRKPAAESLGRVLGRMHASSLSHRDLKEGNLILVNRADRVEAYVIDLDGAKLRWYLSRRLKSRDLARLSISIDAFPTVGLTDRVRFLRAYLAASADGSWEWKAAWRMIARTAAVRGRRKKRKARRRRNRAG